MKIVKILFACLFFASLSFAQSFEGKISMKVQDDETGYMDYLIKGDNIRIEMKGMSEENNMGAFIYNAKTNSMLIVMPEQQMYMEIPFGMYDFDDEEVTEQEMDFDITGETKVINGYKCEKWIFKDEGQTVEAWMTNGLGGFFMFNNPMDQSPKSAWQSKLEAGNYFPMQVIEGGKVVMEVVSVDKKNLSNDLFSVPNGFKKFEMPGMK
jgi:hypothetical protein